MKKTKHIVVMITIAVLLVLEAGFLAYGFQKMETDYVNEYLEQQEKYLAQVNLQLKYMLEQGAQQQELVSYMSEYAPVSGSYYAWLIKEESVIFAKNETVTESLGESQAWPVFQEAIDGQGTCNVSAEFSYNGTDYITGMVIDRSYILNDKSLQKFKMYDAVSLLLLSSVVFSVLVLYIQRFWKEKNKNILMEKELRNKNSALNEMHGDMVNLNHKIQKQNQSAEGNKSYDLQIARKLLEKSDREGIWPAHYAVLQLQMDERQYYGKQKIMDIMDQLSLTEYHVRMEIQKGCFLVLFYRTEKKEVEQILQDAREKWKSIGIDIEIEIRSGSIRSNQSEREWLDKFLEGKGQKL